MAQYQKLERQRTDAIAKIEQLWASGVKTEDHEAAEQEILEETEAVRHGQNQEAIHSALAVV